MRERCMGEGDTALGSLNLRGVYPLGCHNKGRNKSRELSGTTLLKALEGGGADD